MIDTILFALAFFCLGWVVGSIGIVYHATRPNGYEANDGKRYRLTEIEP